MISKRAATGESVMTIYRVLIVTFVAFVVLGISGIIYEYKINASDTDSMLFARAIVDCVIESGILDFDSFVAEEDLFSFCGFGNREQERFFVTVLISEGPEKIYTKKIGNEELEWVQNIFSSGLASENIEAYAPGYFEGEFNLKILKDDEVFNGKVKIEVVTKSEE